MGHSAPGWHHEAFCCGGSSRLSPGRPELGAQLLGLPWGQGEGREEGIELFCCLQVVDLGVFNLTFVGGANSVYICTY